MTDNNLVQVDPRSIGFYGKSYEEIKNRPEALATRLNEVLKDQPKKQGGFVVDDPRAQQRGESLDEARKRAYEYRLTELAKARASHPNWDRMTKGLLGTMNLGNYNFDYSKGGAI